MDVVSVTSPIGFRRAFVKLNMGGSPIFRGLEYHIKPFLKKCEKDKPAQQKLALMKSKPFFKLQTI